LPYVGRQALGIQLDVLQPFEPVFRVQNHDLLGLGLFGHLYGVQRVPDWIVSLALMGGGRWATVCPWFVQ
jgi:hypothetical protein